jgi:hypothetical protein
MALKNPNWKPPRMKTGGKVAILIWIGVPTLIIYGFLSITIASPDKVPTWLDPASLSRPSPVAGHR